MPANTVSNLPSGSKKISPSLEKFPTGRQGASKAQGLYRRGAYRPAAFAYLHAMSNSTPLLQNDCLFNAGCAFYRAGDYNDAADSFGRIAGGENTDQEKVFYNLGCATYRLAEQAGKTGTNRPPEPKPYLLEKAGSAFQRSLRAKLASAQSRPWRTQPGPDFKNAAANLAAVTNMLPRAREDAKLQMLMAKYGNQPPPQLADTMLQNQRNIIQSLSAALTNSAPLRISQFENLAEQQRANADILIPLRLTLLNALGAQGQQGAARQQIPQLEQHLEATRNSMDEGFNSLRDIDNRAYQPARAAEQGIYNLWKGLASFEKLLQEDISRQTNTIAMTTSVLAETEADLSSVATWAKEEQKEAQELTRLFAERFAQAVPPVGTTAAGKLPGMPSAPMPDRGTETQSTNEAPQISAETRTNILYLADQAIKTQAKASEYLDSTNLEFSLPEQRRSYDLLKEIEKLLPKNKKQQQDQQNQDQQKQQQDEEQNQNQKKENQNKQPPPPQPEQQPSPPKQEEKPRQPGEQPSQPEQKDQKEMTPEQMRALLEKARQREKEHREDKMRDEYVPPSPVDRDW